MNQVFKLPLICFISFTALLARADLVIPDINEEMLKPYAESTVLIQPNLNENIWLGDGASAVLKEPVRQRFLKIIKDYTDVIANVSNDAIKDAMADKGLLEQPKIEIRITDAFLTGSACSYNYGKYSDFDVNVFVVIENASPENIEIVKSYLTSYGKNWRTLHDIKIFGWPIEIVYLYDTKSISEVAYSLVSNKWIKPPKKVTEPMPPIEKIVESSMGYWTTGKNAAITYLQDPTKCDYAIFLKAADQVKATRGKAIKEGGIFSAGNLGYKALRRALEEDSEIGCDFGKLMTRWSNLCYDEQMSMQ